MTELRVDAERRIARVGAGVLWGDVVERAGGARPGRAAHQRPPASVSSARSLGGGLSWYARHAGLQCSALTAVELVLADGTFVRATDEQRRGPDVGRARQAEAASASSPPWSSSCCPVTSAYAGMLAWELDPGRPGAPRLAILGGVLPETVTTVARLFRAPDEPWLPDDVRGRTARRHRRRPDRGPRRGRAAVRAPAGPAARDRHRSTSSRRRRWPTCTWTPRRRPRSTPTASCSTTCPRPAIEALVAAAGPDSGSALLFVEIRHLGGALSRPAPRPGVLEQHDG